MWSLKIWNTAQIFSFCFRCAWQHSYIWYYFKYLIKTVFDSNKQHLIPTEDVWKRSASLFAFNTFTQYIFWEVHYCTCRHFWMQAEGRTSRRWCTWGGHWWLEFSITVRSETGCVRCWMKRMRPWLLDRKKDVTVS